MQNIKLEVASNECAPINHAYTINSNHQFEFYPSVNSVEYQVMTRHGRIICDWSTLGRKHYDSTHLNLSSVPFTLPDFYRWRHYFCFKHEIEILTTMFGKECILSFRCVRNTLV